jgi:hypothetical protein
MDTEHARGGALLLARALLGAGRRAESQSCARPSTIDDRHFFHDETAEWRRVLTQAQVERATAMLPERLFDRFGWSRSTHASPSL